MSAPTVALPAEAQDEIERNSYRAIQPGVVEIRDLGDAWVIRAPGPPRAIGYSRAAVLRFVSTGSARGRIEELSRGFRDEGRGPAFAVAHGVSRPRRLPELLAERGLIEVEREAILWTDEAPTVQHLDPGLRVEQVTSASVQRYVEVEAEAFGIPPRMAAGRIPSLRAGLALPGRRAYLVTLRGEALATTRLTVVDGLASLTSIGVVPRSRARGYGRLITAVATRAGLASGARLVWLAVAPDNVPATTLYESLGYRRAFERSLWIEAAFSGPRGRGRGTGRP